MNAGTLGRVAVVGTLVVVLVAMLVLAGAGFVLEDPEQRAQGDAVAGEHTIEGTVVAEDPVTVATEDGQRIVLRDVDSAAVEEGQSFEVAMSLEEPGANTEEIAVSPRNTYFMYVVSGLAGLLALFALLDTWRIHPRKFQVEPRSRPLHDRLVERVRGRYAEGRVRTLDRRRHRGRNTDDGGRTDG